jgi:peptide deformylase
MKLKIYPNPILTQASEPVTEFDQSLINFCDDLYTIMLESDGVGLSAVQVGVLKKIIVIDVGEGRQTLINPEIGLRSGDTFTFSEGCLSVPGYYEDRERPNKILVRFQDTKNGVHVEWFEGLEAFVIQHEMDHLEGKLFIDDLSPLKKNRVRKKIEKTLRRK